MGNTIYRKGKHTNYLTIKTGLTLIRTEMVTQQQTLDRILKEFIDGEQKRLSFP